MQARFNVEREKKNTLFYKSYKNDFCLFQFHSQIEIYFVDEGEMEMLVDGRREVLRAPAVSVSLGYVTHQYHTPERSRSSVLLIPSHLCEEFMAAVKGKRLATPYITDPAVYATLRECYDAVKDSAGNRVKQLGFIYTMLGTLLDETELLPAESGIDNNLAQRILMYIDESFRGGITPASVSQHFGYSQSYISRFFSSSFGTTLSRYISSVRLRNAIYLMREGRYDITYCALESGFASMRTFYRAFRLEFGTSPTEFLKESN